MGVPVGPVEFVPVRTSFPTPAELEQRINNRRVEFNCNRYFSESWGFVKPNIWVWAAISFVWILLTIGFHLMIRAIVVKIFYCPQAETMWSDDRDCSDKISNQRQFLSLFFTLIFTSLIGIPLGTSAFVAVFNSMRENRLLKFTDFFSAFNRPYYYRLVGIGALLFIIDLILSILIIPAIWFEIATLFVLPLHVENQFLDVKLAMKYSIKVIHKNFCSTLGFVVLMILLQIVGLLALIVGIFVTIPIAFCALCYCYHDLIGVNGVLVLVPRPVQPGNEPQAQAIPVAQSDPQAGLHI